MLSILETNNIGEPKSPENPRSLLDLVHFRIAQEQLLTETSLYSSFLLSRKIIYYSLGSAVINKAECSIYNHDVQLLESTWDTVKGRKRVDVNEKSDFLALFSYLCCFIFQGGHEPLHIIQYGDSQPFTAACSGCPQPSCGSTLHSYAISRTNHVLRYLNTNHVPFWSFYQRKPIFYLEILSAAYCVHLWEKTALGGVCVCVDYDSDLCLCRSSPWPPSLSPTSHNKVLGPDLIHNVCSASGTKRCNNLCPGFL